MVELIEEKLNYKLKIHHLEIVDESARHYGHSSSEISGGGHFKALIVSDDFKDKPLVNRHRIVYAALGEMMGNTIHAFSMRTLTVAEYDAATKG